VDPNPANRSVELTLWGDVATSFVGSVGVVIAIKNARVGEYMNSKSLSGVSSTHIDFNPALDMTDQLLAWYVPCLLF
jgi:hypothetical protein